MIEYNGTSAPSPRAATPAASRRAPACCASSPWRMRRPPTARARAPTRERTHRWGLDDYAHCSSPDPSAPTCTTSTCSRPRWAPAGVLDATRLAVLNERAAQVSQYHAMTSAMELAYRCRKEPKTFAWPRRDRRGRHRAAGLHRAGPRRVPLPIPTLPSRSPPTSSALGSRGAASWRRWTHELRGVLKAGRTQPRVIRRDPAAAADAGAGLATVAPGGRGPGSPAAAAAAAWLAAPAAAPPSAALYAALAAVGGGGWRSTSRRARVGSTLDLARRRGGDLAAAAAARWPTRRSTIRGLASMPRRSLLASLGLGVSELGRHRTGRPRCGSRRSRSLACAIVAAPRRRAAAAAVAASARPTPAPAPRTLWQRRRRTSAAGDDDGTSGEELAPEGWGCSHG